MTNENIFNCNINFLPRFYKKYCFVNSQNNTQSHFDATITSKELPKNCYLLIFPNSKGRDTILVGGVTLVNT